MKLAEMKLFVGLLTLADSTAAELGLSSLTTADKQLLIAMWEKHAGSEGAVFNFKHEDALSRYPKLSKAQFYSSINKFINNGSLVRIAGQRSNKYQFCIDK